MILLQRAVVLVGVVLVVLAGGAAPGWAAPAWGWPLAGPPAVTRPFAPGPTPYSPGHRGADLSARPGAAVRSAGPGVVAYAGRLAGRGVVVVVHGALRTTYEPVDASVAVGQVVLRGQRIGALAAGHRGCPAEACLHWGLRRGLDYLDPLRLVGAGPVRLLPREDGSAVSGPGRAVAPLVAGVSGGGAAGAVAPRALPPLSTPAASTPAARASADVAAPAPASGPGVPAPDGTGPARAEAPAPAPVGSAPPPAVVLAVATAGLLARALLRPP